MKKKIQHYSDEPMNFKVIEDFLPPPEKLSLKEENVRVTITLSKASIEFFKRHAKKTHGHYQTMIRKIIDHYVVRYQRDNVW